MGSTIFKIFTIFGIVTTWAQKALEDKVVTAEEGLSLAVSLAQELGLPTSIKLQQPETQATTTHGETTHRVTERQYITPPTPKKPEE